MSALVVDASVAAKAFLPEEHSQECRQVLRSAELLLAPDHIYAEVAHAASRHVRLSGLPLDTALEALADFCRLPFQLEASRELAPEACRLAADTGCTAYDALYVAVAMKHRCDLVTADARLWRTLERTPAAQRIRLIGRPGGAI